MTKENSNPLRKLGLRLARPDILFWILPFLMLLLIVGTIAQKTVGILGATEDYFASFYYFLGFIPLPGGLTLMMLFTLNLLAKFLFKSDWSWKKSGTIITHFGILILVLGGAVTLITSKEGYLVIPQGETRNQIEDYHQRQLVIRDDKTILTAIPHNELHTGLKIKTPAIPFALTIDTYCFNCGITRRDANDQDGWTVPGKFMHLNTKAPNPQDEMNMTGVEFTIDEKDKYLTFDKFPKPPQIKRDGKTYTIAIERATRPLPFSVSLTSFKQDLHPGTEMARAYQSTVTVTDGTLSWPAVIAMNEPLRYKGYTLYQSSFDESGEKPYTVLAVVENKGRIFPYIATLVIALGLILHLGLRLTKRRI